MALLHGLPVYYIKIQEDLSNKEGIDFISLVDYPAIETNWVAMGDHKAPMKFDLNEDKQLLSGPILIPNLPIYRYDETIGEYYVVFTVEEIQKLVRKFQASQKTINLNYQHQKNSQLTKAVVQEIWLTGKVDKSQDLGFTLPVGSAFVVSHIGDKEFWIKEVKSGNVRGYSIEGFLDMEMKKLKTKNIMSAKFISAKTTDGLEIKSDSETLTEGVEVYTEVEGVKAPCTDGDYTLDNGTVITVLAGKITAVTEAEMSTEEIEVIQSAIKPLVDALKAELKSQKDVYEAKVAELELAIKNIPAGKSATTHTDEKKVELTGKQKLKTRLSILSKKSKEISTNQTTK